jgi:signal transduction histidine kinase
MRERAEELGGSCAITSAPGGGLRVDVSLPLASLSATAVSHVNTRDGSVTGVEAS